MSRVTTFEVLVNIKKNGTKHYSSFLGLWVKEEIVKMFHVPARTSKQAMLKCEKHGRPISAHKPNIAKMAGNIENLQLNQMDNPYDNAISMDEMIWRKRNKRIENKEKDKGNY